MKTALILIIDRCSDTRAMYADCFRHYGFAVAEAGDGVEAVRMSHQLQPDLVITELSSEPEWLAAIRTIRGNGNGWKTPIIACSTRIDRRWPSAPAGIDVDVAVGKPVSPHELMQQTEQLLAERFVTTA